MDLTPPGPAGKAGVLAMLCDSTRRGAPGATHRSERAVGASFDELFPGCKERSSSPPSPPTWTDPADRQRGRQLWPESRRHRPEHENSMRVATELGYNRHPQRGHGRHQPHQVPAQGQGVHHHHRKPGGGHVRPVPHRLLHPQAGGDPGRGPGNHLRLRRPPATRALSTISSTNSTGRRPRWSARTPAPSTSPATPARRAEDHPRPGAAQVLHPRPRGAAHLQTHAKVAQEMGTPPENIIIAEVGRVIELTHNSAQLAGTVPAGGCSWTATAWETWAAWSCGTAATWPRTA